MEKSLNVFFWGFFKVNFVKEGCGMDHICRSNLKMEYKLFYKQNNLDDYSPLPM